MCRSDCWDWARKTTRVLITHGGQNSVDICSQVTVMRPLQEQRRSAVLRYRIRRKEWRLE